jgi:hypothetical protein
MKRIALVVGTTLAISGTAFASSLAYDTGVYAGSTRQNLGIAFKVSPGQMDKIAYRANYRCADKQGQRATYKNVLNRLGAAAINSKQEVNAIYHTNNGANEVHLFIAFNHGKAGGWFKQAFTVFHNGHKYLCVTPGGQATVAGKVFFGARVQ